MHGADIIGGVAPIAPGFEISEAKFSLQAALDFCDGSGDFSGDELKAAAGALMIEENAAATLDSLGFPMFRVR
jgi:hypothetical protein